MLIEASWKGSTQTTIPCPFAACAPEYGFNIGGDTYGYDLTLGESSGAVSLQVTKLARISGLGLFHSYVWPSDLGLFQRYNVIYGWNGSGKTTISRIFRYIQDRQDLTSANVEIGLDQRAVKLDGLSSTHGLPNVYVFNRDFIERTVAAFSGGMSPIFYFGQESVEKRHEIERIQAVIQNLEIEQTKVESERELNQKSLDDLLSRTAKSIKDLNSPSHRSYATYDRRKILNVLESHAAGSEKWIRLSGQARSELVARKSASIRPPITAWESGRINVREIFELAAQTLSESLTESVADTLLRGSPYARWIQDGKSFHWGLEVRDSCIFCGGVLTEERRKLIDDTFSDELANLQNKIRHHMDEVTSVISKLKNRRLPDKLVLYEDLQNGYSAVVTSFENATQSLVSHLEDLLAALDARSNSPFSAGPRLSLDELLESSVDRCLDELVDTISGHNLRSEKFDAEVRDACKALEVDFAAEIYDEWERLSSTVRAAEQRASEVKSALASHKMSVKDLERDLIEHAGAASELSSELNAYLGHGDLRIEVAGDGYSVLRNGVPAADLSEGEKSAIALLYFLKSLQARDVQLESSVIVIDDPVSSMDDNSLFSAFSFMRERVEDAGQVFILTHNFAFLRQVKSWFRRLGPRLPGDSRKPSAGYFMLRVSMPDGKRSASIAELDPLLLNFESEYHYLFATLHRFSTELSVGSSLEQYYAIPNAARRLLEGFLSFRSPDIGGDVTRQLDAIGFPSVQRNRVVRLLNTYSHGQALIFGDHDPTVLSETRIACSDVLELIRNTDPQHYAAMIRLSEQNV